MNNQELIAKLTAICGKRHVLTSHHNTKRFRKGFRSGEGSALAVVRPGSLLEQWRVLQASVDADKIVITQASNTGLTGGSTPHGCYDRDVVVLNTNRITGLHLLQDGKQVIGLPGESLFSLEKALKPIQRKPHSVIGSSSIGASIVGGVCNNSGGALCERGPSYTELALFAKIDADGQLHLVNKLGIKLGETPEEILTRLEAGDFDRNAPMPDGCKASDPDYVTILRNVDADTPSRYNNDDRLLYDVSGCAGKLVVFAVRLDTFADNAKEQIFYIGTNDTNDLTEIRRHILQHFSTLPVSAEYMHRDCFNMATKYGKDTLIMIDRLGTDKLPVFFALKGLLDAWFGKLSITRSLTDKFMQFFAKLWPQHLPEFMLDYCNRYEHHLILNMHDEGIEEAKSFLSSFCENRRAAYHTCNMREGKLASLHRFAAAGAAVRYLAIHEGEVEEIIALDIALRRNDRDWFESLPKEISKHFVKTIYYGHLMCHVMHQDYLVKKGSDPNALKAKLLEILDDRGAEYPAEHNVGHLYQAKANLANFYKSIDPTNSLNPGIGKMSRNKNYI